MDNKNSRNITDLPPQLARYICQFLGDVDLVNSFEAIPTWKRIASSLWFENFICQRIKNWSWIDRHLYNCLFPQPTPTTYRYLLEAFSYHAWSHMFPSTRYHLSKYPIERPLIKVHIIHSYHSNTLFDCSNLETDAASFLISYEERRNILQLQTLDNIRQYDSVIYIMDKADFNNPEIFLITNSLRFRQSFSGVIVADAKTDKRSDMKCLLDYIHRFNDSDRIPLPETRARSRLWCLRNSNDKHRQLKELLMWAQEMWFYWKYVDERL